MDQEPRYAIFFVPDRQSRLYRYGCSVLGYDCYGGEPVPFPQENGGGALDWRDIGAAARRYGFHATLKAPFHLSPAASERQLIKAVENFAGLGHAIHSFAPTVRLLDAFYAVVPHAPVATLDALAASCTTLFDAYRAPITARERARRVALGLSPSQIQNLDRWGYPYVLADFKFHMTLTGPVPTPRRKAVHAALLDGFKRMKVEASIALDRLALVKQDSPDASFRVVGRWPLAPSRQGPRR